MASGIDSGLWLRTYHDAPPASTRLVCFPHAGGSASYFLPLSAALAHQFRVTAVQYPGRQDRRNEPLVQTIDELADQVFTAIAPIMDSTVAFFGHSMGAVVAFEVARRLEERSGISPLVVFASGRRAPSVIRDDSARVRDDASVINEIRNLGGTDARLMSDPEMRNMVLPAIGNDYRAVERHKPDVTAQISSPIVVLTGTDDPRTTVDEARAWHGHSSSSADAWHAFDGGHFFLEAHVGRVVSVIAESLDKLSAQA